MKKIQPIKVQASTMYGELKPLKESQIKQKLFKKIRKYNDEFDKLIAMKMSVSELERYLKDLKVYWYGVENNPNY